MCELFAYSAKKEISLASLPEFKEFISHSATNPDGWGIGWYLPVGYVMKEPYKAKGSPLLESLIGNTSVDASLLIAHIRKASRGENTYYNTHPFIHDSTGKTWIFAHNGTVRNTLPGLFAPKGTTDSEKMFSQLLGEVHTSMCQEQDIIAIASQWSGKKNFMLTDGTTLYAYADTSLYYQQCDERVLIATMPLNNTPWIKMAQGKLLVCRNGRIDRIVEEQHFYSWKSYFFW